MQDNQAAKRAIKRFTVAEANAMLPLVSSIVADVCKIFKTVTVRRSDLHRLLRKGARSSGSVYDDEMAESRADLQQEYEQIWKYREELESLGVILRQPEEGVIEFPSVIRGRNCYLSWRPGDKTIRYYREENAPYSRLLTLPSLEKAN